MALMSHHKDSRGDVSLHHVVANLTGQVKLSLDIIIMSLLLLSSIYIISCHIIFIIIVIIFLDFIIYGVMFVRP